MISYITADQQKKIRSELEEVQRLTRQIFLRLKPLERTDERVIRTEQALSALERLLWTMTSGPGRLGPSATVHAILRPPTTYGPEPVPESGRKENLMVATWSLKTGLNAWKEVPNAHRYAE